MKKKQIYEGIVTDRVDFQDKAKVRVVNAPDEEDNGTIITVKNAIPGQKIEFRFKKQGKGDLVRVLEKSPDEMTEVCPMFGECGGCTYQKKADAKDSSERIGGRRRRFRTTASRY